MLCLDMKLITRFRSEKRQQSGGGGGSSGLSPSGGGHHDALPTPPRRDRSKSLCVDRISPLLQVTEPIRVRDDTQARGPAAIFARRRSTTTALSASSDLISRRGVFSRRHYGSVELLPQVETEGSELNGRRFRVESGEQLGDRDEQMYGSPSTPILENPEYQTRWYFKYFLGKLHQNYVGCDSERVPFFLSVVLTDANNQCVPQYRAILWRRTGAQRICLSYTPSKPMTVKQILSNFQNMDKIEKGPKEIFTPEIQKDLLLLEEQEGSVNFKFGILYMRAGQTSDDEILSNEGGSRQWEKFLGLLGERVRLRGWDKFRGGLDVKGDMTGRHSVYTIYEGHEIMFHVSTMLPFSKDNKQQVERKRHIGNDIVNIVFLEGEDMTAFSPSFIKSQFTHVFALVSHLEIDDAYRLHVFSEETVPLFGPSLPCPPIFYNQEEFREFLLVKLINGEKATFNTPTFSQKRERTLDMLIKDLFQEHINDNHRGTMLNRRAFSDVLPDPPRSSRRKEEARQVEFVRFGQALKLDTIVKGDAPTSLATTGLFKRTLTEGSSGSPSASTTALHARPWEPQCCYPDFPWEVVCGDSWGENRLLLATSEGSFLVEEGVTHRPIFDKSVQVKQLSVVEAHGILLVRADKAGKDGKIHVFRLSDFEYEDERVRTKVDLKDHRLDRTKGCHLYAISRPGGSHLRMVVGVGKKLLVLHWRHSAAWTAWCPASDTDTIEGFQFVREISLPEAAVLITLVDSPLVSSAGGAADNKICVGYKHQWDLVSERTGEVTKLHHVDTSKVNLVAALDIYEDDEAELLLCYNNTCHFQKLTEECSNEFDFQWNSVPEAIVCAFPYILAFTQDSIEIRLIINGNLVQTMVMPRLSFITSKSDIFFATTAPEFFTLRRERVKVDRLERDPSLSPPPSPHGKDATVLDRDAVKPFRIYRIPFRCLTGASSCERRCPTPSAPMHPPVLGTGEDCLDDDSGNEGIGCNKRAGMHLRVSDQRYGSRSCTASPTHHPAPTSPFPGCSSPQGSPPIGGSTGSPQHSHYQKPRDRTNSLTVDSANSLLHHGRPHLLHHHHHHHQHHHHHSPVK